MTIRIDPDVIQRLRDALEAGNRALAQESWIQSYASDGFFIIVQDEFNLSDSFCAAVEAIYLTPLPQWPNDSMGMRRVPDESLSFHHNGDHVPWMRVYTGCGYLIAVSSDFDGSATFVAAINEIVSNRGLPHEHGDDSSNTDLDPFDLNGDPKLDWPQD